MLFHTVEFFIFLAIVLAAFYSVPLRWGKVILLAASYFFYMWWNAKFILLLLTLTVIDYTAGLLLGRTERRRKLLLLVSLCANLGFLGFFKYYDFLAQTVTGLLGVPAEPWLVNVILPLGISFHTFQSMSYIVDVYRKQQQPIRNPLDYALFISFFPQLVAGPIVRAREFFRDLYHWRAPTVDEVQQAAFLILVGLVKKMIYADQFARVADPYFQNPAAQPGMLTAWSATLAFALQIFFDFSGYTDMAIGLAKLFGFDFPLNFARPYLAASITEFWRRWHISLSRWLRDYLYIPLGGNRHGTWMTYRNLMLTMLLGGLWHGARWNFVIWGGYQGLLLSLERATGRRPGRVLTFLLALIGWVFFRATTLGDCGVVLSQMFSRVSGTWLLGPGHMLLAGISLVLAVLEEKHGIFERFAAVPRWAQACTLLTIFISLELFAVTDESLPFVYFQF